MVALTAQLQPPPPPPPPPPAWSVERRCAPSRHCGDERVYGLTSMAMHETSTPAPVPHRPSHSPLLPSRASRAHALFFLGPYTPLTVCETSVLFHARRPAGSGFSSVRYRTCPPPLSVGLFNPSAMPSPHRSPCYPVKTREFFPQQDQAAAGGWPGRCVLFGVSIDWLSLPF